MNFVVIPFITNLRFLRCNQQPKTINLSYVKESEKAFGSCTMDSWLAALETHISLQTILEWNFYFQEDSHFPE